MADLSIKYLGLTLANPIIIGSCGKTSNIKSLKELQKQGAAAVVLKSIFEEQIMMEIDAQYNNLLNSNVFYSEKSENIDYLDLNVTHDAMNNYISLIKEAKRELIIPVIPSIHCHSTGEWLNFVKEIEKAGADAIEINLGFIQTDPNIGAVATEMELISIIKKIRATVKLPIAVKISPYVSSIPAFVNELSLAGANAVVLFTRFYNPDIDIIKLEEKPGPIFSSELDYSNTLRWTGILSGKTPTQIVSSTGIHNAETIIKMILAGASAVQIASILYIQEATVIQEILKGLNQYMDSKNFNYISQFNGLFNRKSTKNIGIFDRIQFMKHVGSIE